MNKFLPGITLVVGWMLVAIPSPAVAQDCENGATNMDEVRSCLYVMQQKPLDRTYGDTLSFVRSRDPKAADLLAAAQKSWEKFASDSCDYTAAAQTPNSGYADDTRLNCMATFTDARIKALKAYRQQLGH